MTDAELETERQSILAEEQALEDAQEHLRLTPDDREAHAAHHERLKTHIERVRAFKEAIEQRPGPADSSWPQSGRHTYRYPSVCPVCQSSAITPAMASGRQPGAYRCRACRSEWVMGPQGESSS